MAVVDNAMMVKVEREIRNELVAVAILMAGECKCIEVRW